MNEREMSLNDLAKWLDDYFRALRFDPHHHLGLGDIRLTLGQQDDLVAAAERAYSEQLREIVSAAKNLVENSYTPSCDGDRQRWLVLKAAIESEYNREIK